MCGQSPYTHALDLPGGPAAAEAPLPSLSAASKFFLHDCYRQASRSRSKSRSTSGGAATTAWLAASAALPTALANPERGIQIQIQPWYRPPASSRPPHTPP